MKWRFWFYCFWLGAAGCGVLSCRQATNDSVTLFEHLDADKTGINFANNLTFNNEFNIYRYRNFYNGGGVAVGDVDNDGLLDVYFSSNMEANRLYLNKGGFKFEDATEKAGLKGKRYWSTGVSMVDVNADGWLDIYVCNSGDVKGDSRQNEFFINNGNGTFTDKAEQMGLADSGYSTQAAFLDYDKDGDLDMYLLNNSYQAIGSFNLTRNERPIRDKLGGHKLFQNNNGRFTDVSERAGIYGSIIGFGLGVVVSDLDKDGWPDLYVSNDFFERDYLYINNRDGTFSEELEKRVKSISAASMGVDIADLDGDSWPDVFVTEMLPKDEARLKTTMTFENWDKHHYTANNGYFYQFTRNMLHRNNGLFPGKGLTFSEVGRMAGVEATDWSWGALLADYDNDGFNDLFITNGINQDILNLDYLAFIANDELMKTVVANGVVDYKKLIDIIPSTRIPNYGYAGGPALTFTDNTKSWGLETPSHSNGCAYADLDNDGDLDLLVNNVNMPAFVYRNRSEALRPSNHYLTVTLNGTRQNKGALGAKMTLKANGKTLYREQSPCRGFESSVDPRLHVGLGDITTIDTLRIDWPYGATTILTNVKADQLLKLAEPTASPGTLPDNPASAVPMLFGSSELPGATYRHVENPYVDFNQNRLLFHMASTEGPALAVGDVNGDGLEDFFVGGAINSAGALFVQQKNGHFLRTQQPAFEQDKASEDTGCLLFDADGDHDLDLYVCSGGSELSPNSFALINRLYLNDSKGHFSNSNQLLPSGKPESTAVVKASDVDRDGDLDLFVGGRLNSNEYGVPTNSYLLLNDGKGHFSPGKTGEALKNLGLVTDAHWTDLDRDGDDDLVVVGEWMPITFFENKSGQLLRLNVPALANTLGWWHSLETADLNRDGFPDFVVGNLGLNARFRASADKPVLCYVNDFDQNGRVEQILTQYNGETAYPMSLRHDLVAQLPYLNKRYLHYEKYKLQTVADIFTPTQLKASVVLKASMFESVVVLSGPNQTYSIRHLPRAAQVSPIYATLPRDFDGDGLTDLLVGGNLYAVKPEVGRYDASQGLFLKGNGDGTFVSVAANRSGVLIEGEIRDLKTIRVNRQTYVLVARNNDNILMLKPIHAFPTAN